MIDSSALRAPRELENLPTWLLWKKEEIQGEKKPRKIPYYANGSRRFGVQGSEKDRAQLVTFEEAKAAIREDHSGVGLALMPELEITALDFDDCVHEGVIDPLVESLVQDTYAEFSPSGKGVRAFVKGKLPDRKSHATPEQFGFETFSDKGFVTFTGDVLPITELTGSENIIAAPAAALQALYTERFQASTNIRAQDCDDASDPVGLTGEQIHQALEALSPDCGYDDWLRIGMALHHETSGDGFELWDAWSSMATGDKYPGPEALEAKWKSFGQSGLHPVTARSLVRLANEAGADLRINVADPIEFEVIPPDETTLLTKPTGNPVPLDWKQFPKAPPAPRFIIPVWMPDGTVTLFAAHGGTGKSYLSLFVALCIALGRNPFDLSQPIERQRVVLYSAEDDLAVMQWRLLKYLGMLNVEPQELDGWLLVLDATGCDNVLFSGDATLGARVTSRMRWLHAEIVAFGAKVLIFDNASDAMDANENDRAKVRQFMSVLKRLAPAVLLLAHVDAASSAAGPREGKGYSGSTGWHNSARSRWHMARDRESDEIILSLPKVNYAKSGAEVQVAWDDEQQLFTIGTVRDAKDQSSDNRTVLLMLLERAIERGNNVSAKSMTQFSVYKTLKDMDGFPQSLKAHSGKVQREVDIWLQEGLVVVEDYTNDSRKPAKRLQFTVKGLELAAQGKGAGIADA